MPMEHGRYLGGIREVEDIRIRCRMEDGCWIWVMGRAHGKPNVSVIVDGKRKAIGAARAAVILSGRRIREQEWVVPRDCCPHPKDCVNPAHFKISSPAAVRGQQNRRPDLKAKNRLRGLKHRDQMAKLNPEQVRAIRAARGQQKVGELAEQFGVHKSTVYLIWGGKTWHDVLDIPANSIFSLAA